MVVYKKGTLSVVRGEGVLLIKKQMIDGKSTIK
jgi:hypothetical protein